MEIWPALPLVPLRLEQKSLEMSEKETLQFWGDSCRRIAVCIVGSLLAILLLLQPYDGKQWKVVLDGVFCWYGLCLYRKFAPHICRMCTAVEGGMFNAYLSHIANA